MEAKTFTIVFFTSLILSSVSAQITITAATLPDIGAENRRMEEFDIQSSDIEIGVGEEEETYEFSDIEGTAYTEETYHDPAVVDSQNLFPAANLARINQTTPFTELLLKNNDGIKVLGGISTNPLNSSQLLEWKINGEYYLRKTPMKYKNSYTQDASVYATISADFFPDTLFSDFPLKPDSFRIKVDINSEAEIDGYGLLYLKDFTSVEVLRQDYVERINPAIEARTTFTPWVDVTSLIVQNFPQLATVIESDTINTYRYYSNKSAFSVVEAVTTPTSDMVESVNYNTSGLTTSLFESEIDAHGYDITVNPNPSIGKVEINIDVKEPGDYKIRILNIVGYELWSEKYFIYDKHNEKLDFSQLKRGTYFYSLVSPNGKTLVTKRMLIVGA